MISASTTIVLILSLAFMNNETFVCNRVPKLRASRFEVGWSIALSGQLDGYGVLGYFWGVGGCLVILY
jgi:hypothetical protein